MRQAIEGRGASPDFADVPGGTTGLLIKDYKGKGAHTPVYRFDAALLTEVRAHERQAAQESGQWRTVAEEPRPPGASPAAITLAMLCTLQEALSAGTIALEISSRNARVQALQKRWDYLRAGFDLILDQRGADIADLPGGGSLAALPRLQAQGGSRAGRVTDCVAALSE
jgi:hypothetical protein